MTVQIVPSSPLAPEAQPLIEDLIREYDSRYGTSFDPAGARAEVYRYPPEAFAPPNGAFLLLRRQDETVGGGAFLRLDPETAELKRIWTRSDLRRRGLARAVVLALEEAAAALGYTRLYLTTGFRQPEAEALYVSLGYRRLFDPAIDPALYRTLPFEKLIGARAGQPGTTPPKAPAATPQDAAEQARAAKAAHAAKVRAAFPPQAAAE